MQKFVKLIAGLCFLFSLILMSGAFAHGNGEPDEPAPTDPNEDARLRMCMNKGAQQAWGAEARFDGAPLIFKFVPRDVLQKMFYEDKIPNDGVYLADDMEQADQDIYEERATDGWNRADLWVKEGQEAPGYSRLLAIFYFECKENP